MRGMPEKILGLLKLPSNDIIGMFTIEKNFAVFHQDDPCDSCFDHCVPAPFTAPPVAPEIKVCSAGIVSLVSGVLNGSWFAVILGVATLA